MSSIRLIAGWRSVAAGIVMGLLVSSGAGFGQPAGQFPFDQELLLDTPPMRPGKRMPSLTVERSGNAVIDLWCKSVPARVEFSDDAIKIEAAPLPDELPEMQGNAQCTPERITADGVLLDRLTQVTGWQRQGGAIVLAGPKTLKFRPASN